MSLLSPGTTTVPMQGGGSGAPPRFDKLIEIIAVLLLGITTIGTAWCGYQATRWNGASAAHNQAASDLQVEAARLFGLATQKVAYDSVMTAQYAQAVADGNAELQKFYRASLIRREFLPTLDAWEAEVRAGRQPTPLADDAAYVGAQLAEYRKVVVSAGEESRLAAEAGSTASAYVSVTILLAAALFFAGVVSSFRYRPARALLVAASLTTLAVAAARLAGLPVSW